MKGETDIRQYIKMKKTKVIIIILSLIFALTVLAAIIFHTYYAKMNFSDGSSKMATTEDVNAFNQEHETEAEDSDLEKIKLTEEKMRKNLETKKSDIVYTNDVFNILLIGSDERDGVGGSRSDCMILCSINKKSKEIVLTSFMRDCYVAIPGYGNNRLNAAYSFGGYKLLEQTLEQNFKLEIDRYAKVDFFAFMDIVDSIGGVDITLSDDEIEVLNAYLHEINEIEGKPIDTDYITGSAGTYHLNGKQTLAFTRNRYTGNSDFSRTERQRIVLEAIKNKISTCNIIELNNLLNAVLPNVTTDITSGECVSILLNAPAYMSYDLISNRVPYDGSFENIVTNKMAVLSLDFEENIKNLYRDIYHK